MKKGGNEPARRNGVKEGRDMMRMTLQILASAITLATVGCGGAPDGQVDDEQLGRIEEAFTLGAFTYDFGTQCNVDGLSLHCCPAGKVMVGLNIINNTLFCRDLSNTGYSRGPFADYWTQRNGMHACPVGSVMIGVHVDLNVLYCYPVNVQFEFVDAGGPDTWWGNITCNLPGSTAAFAMSGIRADESKLTCAY